ncbi:MAG TPA: DMT family transporter [Rhizomicrobium sp.]|jgi:drug/metabolite transporter (DMT)-like permease
MWLLFAFSGPVLWAASTHIDKYLVDRYFQNSDTAVLMVFTALIGAVLLPFIWWFEPRVLSLPLVDIAVMTVTGVLYMGAMLIYLRAIQTEEASVVAPFFQVSTLFTFLLAWLFLHETMSWQRIGGGALVVVGAALLSLDASLKFRKIKLRFAGLMLSCGLVMAVSSVLFKYFAVHDDYWTTTFWNFVGEALFGLAILAIPHYLRQFLALFRKSPGAVIAINGANELINLGGGLGVRYAYLFVPVALVSAISSTTTLFVFLFGVLLTRFYPKLGREDLSRRNLLQKGAAAVLVAIGVALVDL